MFAIWFPIFTKHSMSPKTKQPLFLLGRFRSGTTALWQIFNRLPGYTAWYEPLHPILPTAIKHTKPQTSHRGVKDYWSAYRNLLEPLTRYWHRNFSTFGLYMEADQSWPALKSYIDWLINMSNGTPVLQFNRMDLRIGWLRQQYPQARIITIQRHPYTTWLSCRAHVPDTEKNNESYPDAYELMQWSIALANDFPFLVHKPGRHGYFRHYILWRMADLLARVHADKILQLENLTTSINDMADWLGWSDDDRTIARHCLAVPKNTTPDKPGEIRAIEKNVETILEDTGLLAGLGHKPLPEIKAVHTAAWEQWPGDCSTTTYEALNALYSREDEITRLLSIVREN